MTNGEGERDRIKRRERIDRKTSFDLTFEITIVVEKGKRGNGNVKNNLTELIKEIAFKASHSLHDKNHRLLS